MTTKTKPMTVNELIATLKAFADDGAGDEIVEARCCVGAGVWLSGDVTKVEDRGGITLSVEGPDGE